MTEASPDTQPSCFACKAVSTAVLLGTSGYFFYLARSKAANASLRTVKASPRFLYFMSAAAIAGAVGNWIVRDGKKSL